MTVVSIAKSVMPPLSWSDDEAVPSPAALPTLSVPAESVVVPPPRLPAVPKNSMPLFDLVKL